MTGSRFWATEVDPDGKRVQVVNEEYVLLCAVLDGLKRQNPDIHLIEGGAQGADTVAHDWGQTNLRPSNHHTYPARWDEYGRKAGPIRNQQMLDEGNPDFVVAVSRNWANSKGTADMVRKAKKAGLTVFKVTSPYSNDGTHQLRLMD